MARRRATRPPFFSNPRGRQDRVQARSGRGRGLRGPGGCDNEAEIRAALTELLGVKLNPASCRLVEPKEMKSALDDHDWPANTDPNTFYGFHTDDNEILVAKKAPWSVLHEEVHTAVDDRDVARWLCEALTEEVSEYLHKTHGFPWRPTYPEQRRILNQEILTRLRLGENGAVKLARVVAQGGEGKMRPDRRIARGLARGRLRRRKRALERALHTRTGDDMNPFIEAITP